MRVRAIGVVVGVCAALLPTVTAGPAAGDPGPTPVAPVTTEIPLDLAAAASNQAATRPAPKTVPAPDTAPPAETAPSTSPMPGTAPPSPQPDTVPGPEPVTIEHATDGTFSAIGFRFEPTAATPGIEVRVRENGGWSSWETVGLPDGGPDAGSPEAAHAAAVAPDPVTEPLLTTRADAFQVRVTPTDGTLPTGFSAVTVDPGTSAYDAVVAETPVPDGTGEAVSAAGAADIQYPLPAPGIVSRAQWGADEGIRTADPDCVKPRYDATVKIGFVHHTASTNSYDPTTALQNIRAIYAYDAQVLGWCDIAYNFLVDKYGRIFEGRYGGVDRPVHGTHTGGFNTNTFAVAALGNYQEIPPSTVMVSSIAHILGWKLGLYHRNVHGRDTLTSAGGGTSKYAAGVSVTFNVISGHRDPGATLCPGQYLYDRLPSIRSGAAPIAAQVLQNYTAVSSVKPVDQQVAYGTRAKWSAFLQVSSGWTLTIVEACSGQVVRRYTGYAERGTKTFDWDLRNQAGALVRGGAYNWSWQTAIGGSASGSIDVMPPKETAAAGTGTAAVTNAGFVPITPARVYDSRKGGKQPLGAASSRSIKVTGVGGLPSSGVAAVALNVTAACSTTVSYLTSWSAGTAKPATSSLNFAGSDAVPGMVVTPVGTGGAVNLYNSAGSTDVIVDVVGYFPTSGGSGYRAVTPIRALDGWAAPIKGGQARVLPVAQQLGIPAGQLTGVAVNVTIADANAPGYVQLSPGSGTTTATSTANIIVGQDVANRAFVGVQNGQLTVRLAGTSAAVFVDVVGYFTSSGSGDRYTSVAPARVLDTRNGTGASGALAAGQTATVSVAGAAVPSDAGSVLATLTSDQATTRSYLVGYAAGSKRPATSDLNPWPGVAKANAVLTAIGPGRSVTIYNNQGRTAVILDVVGYFR